jgi:hypothetical protein
MNKELKLPRTQPTNKNTSVPLENVTNLLGVLANVLPLDANGNKIRPDKCIKMHQNRKVKMRMKTLLNQQLRIKKTSLIQKIMRSVKKHDLIRHKNSCQAKAATKKNCRMNFIYLFHLALNFI